MLIGSYPPPYGGVATYTEQLARLLGAAGHECIVLGSTLEGHDYPPNVHRLGGLLPRLLAFRPQVVHDIGRLALRTTFDREDALSFLVLSGWGSRVVASLHHGGVAGQLASFSPVRRVLTSWKFSRVAHFVLDTTEIRDAIQAFGVPTVRTTVISPQLPLTWREVPIRPALARFLESHSPVLGTSLWRLVPYYGLDLTLRVLGELRQTYPGIGLFVSLGSREGDAGYAKRIAEAIAREGLESRVLFNTEDVGRDEFLSIMARFDALLRPSFVDADSLSVWEGLQLGLPVVASDADRRPEGTTVFKCGDWTDYFQKLASVLQDRPSPRVSHTMLEASGAANFDRLLEVYRRVHEGVGAPR
jgi:glycosyltransferase involved in cell wall biosynthesis